MRRFVTSFLLLAATSVALTACNQADDVKQPWTFHGKIPMEGEMVYTN